MATLTPQEMLSSPACKATLERWWEGRVHLRRVIMPVSSERAGELVVEARTVFDTKVVGDSLRRSMIGIDSLGDVLVYTLADGWRTTVHTDPKGILTDWCI